MSAPLTKAEHELKKWQAHGLSVRGQHAPAIAATLRISVTTTKGLIHEATRQLAKLRESEGYNDLQLFLDEQDAVIFEGWKRLSSTKDNSLNVSGLLSTISQASERKAKAVGVFEKADAAAANKTIINIRRYVGIDPDAV